MTEVIDWQVWALNQEMVPPATWFLSGFPSHRETVMLRAATMTNAPSRTALTPAASGYAMPAEWERHAATWLAWPHHEADWPGKMEAIRWVYAEMVRKLAPGELVRLLVRHEAEGQRAQDHFRRSDCDSKNVRFVTHPTFNGEVFTDPSHVAVKSLNRRMRSARFTSLWPRVGLRWPTRRERSQATTVWAWLPDGHPPKWCP